MRQRPPIERLRSLLLEQRGCLDDRRLREPARPNGGKDGGGRWSRRTQKRAAGPNQGSFSNIRDPNQGLYVKYRIAI
jgi:hypothetical protein